MPSSSTPEPRHLYNGLSEAEGDGARKEVLLNFYTKDAKRLLDKLSYGVGLARGKNKVFGVGLLQHTPHTFHVVTSYMSG